MALSENLSNPSVTLLMPATATCSGYESILDKYRLVLENLSFAEQRERCYYWAERMLTRTDLNLEDPFWTRMKTVTDVRNYRWDRHIDVHDLVKCYLPRVNAFVDSKRESYALLCLLFELRTEYQKFPKRRDYIRDVAKKCTERFLCQLQERKDFERYARNALRGMIGISSVMVGSWMFSVSPLTMCLILWVGKKILY
ncbi:hypothetical protein AVEN_236074-1 [Araneus ventricosus]|uniref:Uncharacterized protein n=1 Tax=Araneus ventricosus TaxID=182803 RepID=A0A4Y2VYL1_ARAVE|nr:hypothetical protein AVEN_236074-1 [Araneus ventricosus]